eukprot:scaffold55684_cov101-Phaeocystis_antarctica.AAC.8
MVGAKLVRFRKIATVPHALLREDEGILAICVECKELPPEGVDKLRPRRRLVGARVGLSADPPRATLANAHKVLACAQLQGNERVIVPTHQLKQPIG